MVEISHSAGKQIWLNFEAQQWHNLCALGLFTLESSKSQPNKVVAL